MYRWLVLSLCLLLSTNVYSLQKISSLKKLEDLQLQLETAVQSKMSLGETLDLIKEIRNEAADAYLSLNYQTTSSKDDESFDKGTEIYEQMLSVFIVKLDKSNKKIDHKSCLEAKSVATNEMQDLSETPQKVSESASKTEKLIDSLCNK